MFTCMQSQGVHLSEDGTGQVLIFPYYTVNGDFNTLITLTNTTDQAKALRLRFREAANAREVLSLNLYLGTNDVWTGALVASQLNGQTVPKLISFDQSCTQPLLSSQGLYFNKEELTGNFSDVYGTEATRLSEGFVEVFEMGVLTGDSAQATILYSGGVPASVDCSKFINAWDVNHSDNYWINDPNTDMLPPNGGISGDITLIDVQQGIAVNESATVLTDFTDETLNFSYGSESPSLADAKLTSLIKEDSGNLREMTWTRGIDAVSSVLMASSISNEYNINPDIGAATDWIITMPTRQYYRDERYVSGSTNTAPFSQRVNDLSFACELMDLASYNREQDRSFNPIVMPDPPPPGFQSSRFCYATNSLHITPIENIFAPIPIGIYSSSYTSEPHLNNNILQGLHGATEFNEGWASITFNDSKMPHNSGADLRGLPVIGFSTQQFLNDNVQQGIKANYADLSLHKKSLVITDTGNNTTITGMQINKKNHGQVLIFPYYTVRNEFDTLITVVNSTDKVKAVKVRFREGKNARSVLEFNLYLSQQDVWTAALVSTASTIPNHIDEPSLKIITSDTSCTVPTISGQEFSPHGYDPQDNGDPAFGYDQQGTSLERSQEGFIEIIEMGTVTGEDADNAMHIAGTPNNCDALIANWSADTGKWLTNPNENLQAPDGSGGLSGSVQIINVLAGLNLGYVATAIQGYSTEIQHSLPSSLEPNLASGNNATTLINTDTNILRTTWDSPLDAVSALFMSTSVQNDFDINQGVGAQTDWVNTYPTKQFYVDSLYTDSAPTGPFTHVLEQYIGSCDSLSFSAFDREQKADVIGGFTPLPPGGIELFNPRYCHSINTSYADGPVGTPFLGSQKSIFNSGLLLLPWIINGPSSDIYELNSKEGTMKMDIILQENTFLTGTADNGDTHTIYGKPILGFVAQKYVNGTLIDNDGNAILANYGLIKQNKKSRTVDISTPAK